MIRILQISDIHFLSCEDEDDNYSQLRQRLLDDVDDLICTRGDVDVILVCGDIANKGQREEYDKAHQFFTELASHSHCSLDRIYLVPGNHDVNWNSHKTTRELLRKELFDEKTNDETLSKWRNEEPLALVLAHAPFENYREMALVFNSNDDLAKAIIDGEQDLSKRKMYWTKEIGQESGYHVNLFGMSTALISGAGDFMPEKGTGQKMFLPKCSFMIVAKKEDINISMMHHPMTHVLRGNVVEKALDNRFQIQLYGHTHKQSSDAKDVIKIYSGALQPEEAEDGEYVPIYNLIEIRVDDTSAGKKLVVDLYSRQGNDSGFIAYKREKETLSIPLKHENHWASTVSPQKDNESDNKEIAQSTTLMKRTINEISYLFLNMNTLNAKKVMLKIYKDSYDIRLSDRINRLRFLQRVKKDNKYDELDKLIPEDNG